MKHKYKMMSLRFSIIFLIFKKNKVLTCCTDCSIANRFAKASFSSCSLNIPGRAFLASENLA